MTNPAFLTNELNQNLQRNWGWFLVIGAVLVVLGCFALSYQLLATVFSVYYLGVLLLLAGLAQVFQSFKIKRFGQTALWAVMGVLYIIIALAAFAQPFALSSALTLIIGIVLLISGVAQILGALNNKNLPRWGWLLTSGSITFILGLLIMLGWPGNSLWVLGMFLGIDLLCQGWAYITIGLALKSAK